MRRRVKFKAIHGHKNSVEPGRNAVVSGSGHTTGVWRNESDKPDAVPGKKRSAGCRQRQYRGGNNWMRFVVRQSPGQDGRRREGKLVLRAGWMRELPGADGDRDDGWAAQQGHQCRRMTTGRCPGFRTIRRHRRCRGRQCASTPATELNKMADTTYFIDRNIPSGVPPDG